MPNTTYVVGCSNYPTDAHQQVVCIVPRPDCRAHKRSAGLDNPMEMGPAFRPWCGPTALLFHKMLGFRVAPKVSQVGPLGLTILRVTFQLASRRSQF